jgi:hypothetical protein
MNASNDTMPQPDDADLQATLDELDRQQLELEAQLLASQQEQEAKLNTIQQGFRARRKREGQRFEAATDSEYWFDVCFQSRAQKEAFLAALNWIQFGDKMLDGCAIAAALGIELPEAHVEFNESKPDRRLNEISLPLE